MPECGSALAQDWKLQLCDRGMTDDKMIWSEHQRRMPGSKFQTLDLSDFWATHSIKRSLNNQLPLGVFTSDEYGRIVPFKAKFVFLNLRRCDEVGLSHQPGLTGRRTRKYNIGWGKCWEIRQVFDRFIPTRCHDHRTRSFRITMALVSGAPMMHCKVASTEMLLDVTNQNIQSLWPF